MRFVQTSEKRRNSILADLLFISGNHPLAALVYSFYDRYTHLQPPQRFEVTEEIDPNCGHNVVDQSDNTVQ